MAQGTKSPSTDLKILYSENITSRNSILNCMKNSNNSSNTNYNLEGRINQIGPNKLDKLSNFTGNTS